MSKFTITLHGRGSEINVHPITDDQREKLENIDLNNTSPKVVSDILELSDEFNLVDTDEIYIGAYRENSQITVMDEYEEQVFSESCEKLIFDELISPDNTTTEIYQSSKLYVNDYIKGNFFTLEIEEDSFDPKLLQLNYTEVEGLELISSFKYKDKESEFGDYWSKGMVYFLSND